MNAVSYTHLDVYKRQHPYCVDHFIQYVTDTKALATDPNARYID